MQDAKRRTGCIVIRRDVDYCHLIQSAHSERSWVFLRGGWMRTIDRRHYFSKERKRGGRDERSEVMGVC